MWLGNIGILFGTKVARESLFVFESGKKLYARGQRRRDEIKNEFAIEERTINTSFRMITIKFERRRRFLGSSSTNDALMLVAGAVWPERQVDIKTKYLQT